MNYLDAQHELLHKLFVLESNDISAENPWLDEYSLTMLIRGYSFQMSDRSNADGVHIGYVSDYLGDVIVKCVSTERDSYYRNKIIYSLRGDE